MGVSLLFAILFQHSFILVSVLNPVLNYDLVLNYIFFFLVRYVTSLYRSLVVL